MKNLIFILAVLSACTGCGAMKRNKSKEQLQEKSSEHLKEKTSEQLQEKNDQQLQYNNHTKTTNQLDTNIHVPGDSLGFITPLSSLIQNGGVSIDGGDMSIDLKYNPATGQLTGTTKSKPKVIPVKVNSSSESFTNIKQDQQHEKKQEKKSDIDLKKKDESESNKKNVAAERKASPWYFSPWPWLLIAAAVVCLAWYIRHRYSLWYVKNKLIK